MEFTRRPKTLQRINNRTYNNNGKKKHMNLQEKALPDRKHIIFSQNPDFIHNYSLTNTCQVVSIAMLTGSCFLSFL